MRKFGLLWTTLLLLTALCTAALADTMLTAKLTEPGEGDLSREDALRIAREAWAEANGGRTDETNPESYALIACFVALDEDGGEARAWHMTLLERGTGKRIETLVYSPDGEKITQSTGTWADKVAAWEAAKGPRPFWTPEDSTLFYHLYDWVVGENTFAVAMPPQGGMSREEAIAAAIETLVNEKSADEAALKALEASATYWEPVMDNPGPEDIPYWAICFYSPDVKASDNYDALAQVNIGAEDGKPFFVYSLDVDGPGHG